MEECRFEAVVTYNEEAMRHYTTYHYHHKALRTIVVFFLAGLALLLSALWLFFRDGMFLFFPALAALGAGLVIWAVVLISGRASLQVPLGPDGQPLVCRLRFCEDRVEVSSAQKSSFYRYDQLEASGEDGQYLFLYTGGDTLVLRWDGLTGGTPDQLRDFLRSRCAGLLSA